VEAQALAFFALVRFPQELRAQALASFALVQFPQELRTPMRWKTS